MLNKFVRQLRPIQENKVAPIEKVQMHFGFLSELTISPDYVMKGEENPFYDLDIDIEKDIRPAVGKGEIKFKNVKTPVGTEIKNYGGTKKFQINLDDTDTDKYITTTIPIVKSHLGQKQRKDATASSNVNEFLTVYFLLHRKYTNPEDFMNEIGGKIGDTGVLNGNGYYVDYDELRILLDKDESAERDILIGYNNSKAIVKDLKSRKLIWKVLHWVPQAKPGGIRRNNPSDTIIELDDGTYIGYSNKISAGKDATPKLNTAIWSAYKKLEDSTQLKNIEQMIDKSWNDAASRVKPKTKNAFQALRRFNISREKFSETTSQAKFAQIAKEFDKDKLKFFFDDMYYPFRNNLLTTFSKYLKNPINIKYFMNTIVFYTYDDPNQTPCPYKLLIGSEKGSTLKDVVSDDSHRQIFFSDNPRDFSGIITKYDGKSQSFQAGFVYAPLKLKVTFPVVLRTRTSGGWGGKNLYITTSGFKIK